MLCGCQICPRVGSADPARRTGSFQDGQKRGPPSKIIRVIDYGALVRRHELNYWEWELRASLIRRAATGEVRLDRDGGRLNRRYNALGHPGTTPCVRKLYPE